MKRCLPPSVSSVHICPMVHQQRHDIWVSSSSRGMQWRATVYPIPRVRIGPPIQKQLYCLLVSFVGSVVKRRLPAVVDSGNIGTVLEEDVDQRPVVRIAGLSRCDVERRHSPVLSSANVGTAFQQ